MSPPALSTFLVPLLALLCISPSGHTFSPSLEPRTERCIEHKPAEPKYFYYGSRALNIRILTTLRVTHRLTSTILQIFAEEVLGYSNVTLHYLENQAQGFDPDTQFSYISSCTDHVCTNLDLEHHHTGPPSRQVQTDDRPVPTAMVNMEMWLPPTYEVEDWKLKDVGRLGPQGRFGWFMPEKFARNAPPIKDHWRAFTSYSVANLFAPAGAKEEKFIHRMMKNDNMSYVCQESYCEGRGMYTSKRCRNLRHSASYFGSSSSSEKCALMLTDFPIHSSLFSTRNLLQQIEDLGLLVNVAFVGENLLDTVKFLTSQSQAVVEGQRSYLLYHYTPSRIVSLYNFTSIKFEYCDRRWDSPSLYQGNVMTLEEHSRNGVGGSSVCLYNFNRFAKVVWSPLKEGAAALYNVIKTMEFSPQNYNDLLRMYNHEMAMTPDADPTTVVRRVACNWLKEPEPTLEDGEIVRKYETWTGGPMKQKLLIGGIFPLGGDKFTARELLPVAALARDHVNANSTVLPNYELDLHGTDGQCTADVVMKRFIDIITNKAYKKSFVGILGPACSDTVEPIAGVSKHFRTVVITYSAEGSITSDDGSETQYPYFFRTIAENKQYKYVYLEIFKKFEWSKVASLTMDGHKYSEYISHLQDVLQTHGINFIMNRKFPTESPDMSMYLHDLKERGARVIIGEFFERAARVIMCEAYKQGMTQRQGYVWFLPGWYANDWYDVDAMRERIRNQTSKEDEFMPNCTTPQMIEAISGHLSLIHATYANDDDLMQTNQTVAEWKRETNEILMKINIDSNQHSKYIGYVYDAVWLYALALDRLIKQNRSYIQDIHSDRSTNELVRIISETDFHGVTGRINFLNGNSRLSNIKIMQWYSNETHEIGVYEPDYTYASGNGKLLEWKADAIRWQTSDGARPEDHAKECSILSGFATALDVECEHAIVLAFVIGFVILIICLLLLFFVLKRRYENKMRQTEERMRALGLLTPTSLLTLDEWEIPRDRVVINRKLGEGAFGTVYGGEAFFDEKGWSSLERLWSVPSFKDIAMRTDQLDSNYIHKDGVLRVAVAVKTLKKGSSVDEKIDFLSEADMMKRFDHKNIVKLLGVCTRNEPVYTVMEFMLYGDLKTYLLARRHLVNERNREEMDEVSNRRLTSMALDVARGLSYLAELKYVHRDVACRNCLVNSSRIVKLADFGMTRPMYENDYYRFNKKGMLPVRWMAPESLSDGLFTPMSDVWSYGVLLYEMITFGSFPFQGLSNNQVLEHVKAGNTLAIPSCIKPQLETLLKSCWHKTPTKRPTASEIVELLSNNPRLILPCIDVPLASVQVERTDSLELIPVIRKPSGSVSQTGRTALKVGSNRGTPKDNSSGKEPTADNSSGPYSPMNGVPSGGISPSNPFRYDVKEPLLGNGHVDPALAKIKRESPDSGYAAKMLLTTTNSGGALSVGGGSSPYVPPGYITLDHCETADASLALGPTIDLNDYVPSSV